MTENRDMKGAILTIAPEVLRELLQLPSGAVVEDIWIDRERPGLMRIRISGAGWCYREGEVLMHAPAGIMTNGCIEWHLPGNESITQGNGTRAETS